MKNILLSFTLLLIVSPLWPSSFKFIAMDKYYDKSVPIDSILVNNMNTGEEKLYLTDSIFFETISSVEDISNTNNLQLYPNPVGDILNVNIQNSLNQDLIISDINGRVQYRTPKLNSGQISLNVAGLPQGVYAIRSGNQSQTFVKNTSSNGQEISLLTTSYMPNSLVKEAEVQSQFDYRFTIYSKGFKPYIYNSMALTKDTVVKLDMAAVSIALFGKKLRFEINLKDVNVGYEYRAHDAQGEKEGEVKIEDRAIFYDDTLIFRNNSIEMIDAKGKSTDGIFHLNKLNFDIDTLNKTISNLSFSHNYRNMGSSSNEKFYLDELEVSFVFDNIQKYIENNITFVKIYLNNIDFTFNYYKKYMYQNDCPGHYTYTKFGSFDKANSYIKIEFID